MLSDRPAMRSTRRQVDRQCGPVAGPARRAQYHFISRAFGKGLVVASLAIAALATGKADARWESKAVAKSRPAPMAPSLFIGRKPFLEKELNEKPQQMPDVWTLRDYNPYADVSKRLGWNRKVRGLFRYVWASNYFSGTPFDIPAEVIDGYSPPERRALLGRWKLARRAVSASLWGPLDLTPGQAAHVYSKKELEEYDSRARMMAWLWSDRFPLQPERGCACDCPPLDKETIERQALGYARALLIRQDSGDLAAAEDTLRRAMKRIGERDSLILHLGDVLVAEGKCQEALEDYQKFLDRGTIKRKNWNMDWERLWAWRKEILIRIRRVEEQLAE